MFSQLTHRYSSLTNRYFICSLHTSVKTEGNEPTQVLLRLFRSPPPLVNPLKVVSDIFVTFVIFCFHLDQFVTAYHSNHAIFVKFSSQRQGRNSSLSRWCHIMPCIHRLWPCGVCPCSLVTRHIDNEPFSAQWVQHMDTATIK